MVAQLQVPAPDSQPLRFDKRYPRSLLEQFLIMIRKNFTLYWRLTDYNAVRLFFTCIFGLLIGSIYWRKGNKTCAFPPLIHFHVHPWEASAFRGTESCLLICSLGSSGLDMVRTNISAQ